MYINGSGFVYALICDKAHHLYSISVSEQSYEESGQTFFFSIQHINLRQFNFLLLWVTY